MPTTIFLTRDRRESSRVVARDGKTLLDGGSAPDVPDLP
jgi:hypothetical protein